MGTVAPASVADAGLVVDVDKGSTSSLGCPLGRAWLVRIRRGNRSVIVAIGLSRTCADNLADQLANLLGDSTFVPVMWKTTSSSHVDNNPSQGFSRGGLTQRVCWRRRSLTIQRRDCVIISRQRWMLTAS